MSELIQIIFGSAITGIVALMWHDVRSIRKETKADLKIIVESHHKCQRELPEKYASRDSVDRLWNRTDSIEADLSFVRGKMNGTAK